MAFRAQLNPRRSRIPIWTIVRGRNTASFNYRLQLPADSFFTPADKVPIDTILFHQLIVCAALDDLSLVHHKDLIGMADGF